MVLELVNDGIAAAGLVLTKGRIVDSSFIEAPSSTKNRDHKRDTEMASGKNGNTWHFGMKMHVATDSLIGIVTNAVYGPTNEHDISRARELTPSETEQVYGDAGYVGMGKREEFQTDKEAEKRSYRINLRPGVLKGRSAEILSAKSSTSSPASAARLSMSLRV